MSIQLVLFFLALICFVLAAVQVPTPRVNLTALGLAFWMCGLIIKP